MRAILARASCSPFELALILLARHCASRTSPGWARCTRAETVLAAPPNLDRSRRSSAAQPRARIRAARIRATPLHADGAFQRNRSSLPGAFQRNRSSLPGASGGRQDQCRIRAQHARRLRVRSGHGQRAACIDVKASGRLVGTRTRTSADAARRWPAARPYPALRGYARLRSSLPVALRRRRASLSCATRSTAVSEPTATKACRSGAAPKSVPYQLRKASPPGRAWRRRA